MSLLESTITRRFLQGLIIVLAAILLLVYSILLHHHGENVTATQVVGGLFDYVVLKLLWVLAFLIVGYGLGRFFLDLIRVSNELDTVEDDIVFSIATGWGIIGLGALLLGSIGLLQPWLHVILGLAVVALSFRQILGLWTRLRTLKPSDMNRLEILVLAIIVAVAIWGLPYSLVPEYGFDSLNSHLPAPRTYIEEGRISFHPEVNFNNFPETVEMWFMESMMVVPLRFGTAAPLLMGICHLLTALAVFAMGRRFFGRGAGLVAALMYMLIRKVFLFATLAFIDQGLTLMVVLGTYAVLRYIEKPSRSVATLAGLMFGIACGIKYSAFITVAMMASVAIIFEAFSRRGYLRFLTDMLIAIAILLLICCPWYIRNWVWFHNPFFPFFPDRFAPGGAYAGLIADLKVDHRAMLGMFALPHGKSPVDFISLPFSLAFDPFGPYDSPKNTGAIGPWFLMSLPLIIFLRRFPRAMWTIAGTVVLTFAYWWFVEGILHLRYMLPVYSLMSVFSGYLVWDGLRLDSVKGRGVLAGLAMAVVFSITVTFFAGMVVPEQLRGEFPITTAERQMSAMKQMNQLTEVDALNRSFQRAGTTKSERVYGFYMEQCRWQARFKLIGNQVGYADHEDYLAHASSAKDLHDWLKRYGCDFLVVNVLYARMQIGDDALKADPSRLRDWEEYFQQLSPGPLPVYRVK